MMFVDYFIGHEESLFWGTSIYRAPENEIVQRLHEVPFNVKVAPFIMLVIGFMIAYLFYILRPRIPQRLAEMNRPIYDFLLNKWYFDELYDLIFVRPALRLGAAVLDQWRWLAYRRSGARRPIGPGDRCYPQRGAAPVRLCLSLRLRHAHRRRGAHHVVYVRRGTLMTGWPVLSLVTFLPMIGALFVLVVRGEDRVAVQNSGSRRCSPP